MKKKKTDKLQGMLDLLILRSLRGGSLNGSRHYESHPDRHHLRANERNLKC